MMFDTIVLGAGPAGWSVAAACARRGMSVAMVAPDLSVAWPRNYGAWLEELQGTVAAGAVDAVFDAPQIATDQGSLVLDASYAKLSTELLQASLTHEAALAGVRLINATAVKVLHHDTGSSVTTKDGRSLDARVVVDATGAASLFVRREPGPPPAFQAAYGELLDVDAHPFGVGEMALMDLRSLASDVAGDPTFLYALPLSPTRIFVEETSLVRRTPLSQQRLRSALGERLQQLGIRTRKTIASEVCLIPMGLAVPRGDQHVIAYGAAASFTHPASGYQLVRTMRLAAPVAAAIARGLEVGPAQAAANAYDTMWPPADRAAWAFYRFGMDALIEMDRARLTEFMHTFFGLGDGAWRRYMTGALAPTDVMSTMLHVLVAGSGSMRRELLGAARKDAVKLIGAAWQGVAS